MIADTEMPVLARAAAQACLERFDFADVAVFTDSPDDWSGLNPVRIDTIRGIGDYNRLVLRGLVERIRTDHFLIAQYDGFVLNGSQWSPHFLHYDYIGAPWRRVAGFNVGNGGFSLRTRRLAEIVARLEPDGMEPEDVFVCRTMRPVLESQHRIHFAPEPIAAHFSTEGPIRRYPTFGFHGPGLLPFAYRDRLDFLIEHLSPRAITRKSNLANAIRTLSAEAFERFSKRRDQCLAAQPGGAGGVGAGASAPREVPSHSNSVA